MSELESIRTRYARRKRPGDEYDPLAPHILAAEHERERVISRILSQYAPVADRTLLEVGCGWGTNLLGLIRLGFRPENLTGNELLEERARAAGRRLPQSTRIIAGDARGIEVGPFDFVYQSTVFSSILESSFRMELARRMWELTKPGGAVLWYDMAFNNPRNQDVVGLPLSEVRTLFPEGSVSHWRVRLAPPIARRVAGVHPVLVYLLQLVVPLRSHLLCSIRKQ